VVHIPIPTYEQMKRKVQRLEKEALRRKQADEVLRKSEERYRMIFNHSPLGIVHFDSNGMIVDCNECFLEIMGAPKEKLIGFNMAESLRDEKMRSAVIAGLSGKPNYFGGDYRSVTGNKVTPVRAMYRRITTEDGRVLGAVGLFEDITERKKSEEALRESQEYLRKIANSISDPIFVKDRQHHLILVNDAFCTLAGCKREDLLGRTGYDFFPKEQVDIFWQKDEIVFETGEENENEEALTDAQGITRTVVTKKTLYTDNAGNKFIVGVIRDITDRKEAERELREYRDHLEDLVKERTAELALANERLHREIEERMRAEQALRESERDLNRAQFVAKTGSWRLDVLNNELIWSDETYRIFGIRKGTPLTYETFLAHVHPEDRDYVDRKWSAALLAENYDIEHRIVVGDRVAWVRERAELELDEKGTLQGGFGTVQDITERKRMEEELRGASLYNRSLIEASLDPLVTISQEGKITDVNEATIKVTGVGREQLIGTDFSNYFTEPELASEGYRQVLEKGFATDYPLTIRHSNGKLTHVLYNASVYKDSAGKVMGIFAAARDITERKLAEEALHESQQMLQLVLDTIPARVFWKDLDSNYLGCNRPFAFDAGLRSPAEIIGRNDFEMVWGELAQLYRSGDRQVIETGIAILGYEETQIAPSGGRICVRTNKVPLFDVQGGIKGVLGTYEDITDQKQAEEELRKAHDELERRVDERTAALKKANKELRQFPSRLISVQEEERKRLASELHDSIGQTLAAVKFWVEMALKLRDEGDDNAALNQLEQFVPTLQRSIEETRSICMGLRPSMLDSHGLLTTLEWLRQECMKLYPERHIELEAGIAEEEIPENLKVNIFRITQEALNNIAKHSNAEWVDISLSKNVGGIELVVSDDGVGMDLDHILQTHTARSLGLTSMRERAELTGGSLSIRSVCGEGTTIRAFWPVEAEDQPQ